MENVSPARIERTTYGLEVRRSVLLSYGDIYYYLIAKKRQKSKKIKQKTVLKILTVN